MRKLLLHALIFILAVAAALTADGQISPVPGRITPSWGLVFLGDSNTCGYNNPGASCAVYSTSTVPYTLSYPSDIQARTGLPITNNGISGYQACDVFPNLIFPAAKLNDAAYASGQAPTYVMALGTNDVDVKGAGPYEATFSLCHLASITWLATPAANRILPGSGAITVTGGFTNTPNATYLNGMYAGSAGTATYSLPTFGNSIYVWYYLNDAASTQGFTVSVDGGPQSALITTAPATHIATQAGTTASVGVYRIPGVAAGTHSVAISTPAGGVAILAVGTNPQVPAYSRTAIAVTDVANTNAANCATASAGCAPPAQAIQYSADIAQLVSLAQNDGIDARYVKTRSWMLGTVDEMTNDGLHMGPLGHQHFAQAVMASLQPVPTFLPKTYIPDSICVASCTIPETADVMFLGVGGITGTLPTPAASTLNAISAANSSIYTGTAKILRILNTGGSSVTVAAPSGSTIINNDVNSTPVSSLTIAQGSALTCYAVQVGAGGTISWYCR